MIHRKILPVGLLLIGLMGFSGPASAFSLFGHGGRHDNHRVAEDRGHGKRQLKRERVRGTVTKVRGQVAYVRTSPFHTVAVQLGPEAYWEERGYRLVPGERVTVVGWYDPYVHSDLVFAGTIAGPGFSFSLTNGVGAPLWVTDYEYVSGWYPTYDTYEVWYRPTYRYVRVEEPVTVYGPPEEHVVKVPPGHVRSAAPRYEKTVPQGHVKSRPRGHVKHAPAPQASHGKHGHGGPRGK